MDDLLVYKIFITLTHFYTKTKIFLKITIYI